MSNIKYKICTIFAVHFILKIILKSVVIQRYRNHSAGSGNLLLSSAGSSPTTITVVPVNEAIKNISFASFCYVLYIGLPLSV